MASKTGSGAGARSMTGFGRGEATVGDLMAVIEISSVNRRQFDCVMTLPRDLSVLEAGLTQLIRTVIRRGYVKVGLRLTNTGQPAQARDPQLDLSLASSQIHLLRQAGKALGLPDKLDLRDLLKLPEAFTVTVPVVDAGTAWPVVSEALRKALHALDLMRQREGRVLVRDISRRAQRLGRLVQVVARRAPTLVARHRQLLLKRLRNADLPISGDDPGLLREVALYADRCDISEELTRLNSHLEQFHALVGSDVSVGRPLDFLCQECFREINTIGSKAGDAAIIRDVIRFKSELEAVREQAQNIE